MDERFRLQVERAKARAGAAHALATAGIITFASARPRAPVPRTSAGEGWDRILGADDLLDVAWLGAGLARAASVGHLRVHAPLLDRHGTGFLLAASVVATNHHVIANADEARVATIAFDHEPTAANPDGSLERATALALDPDALFFTDEELNVTLVAIREAERGGLVGRLPLPVAPPAPAPSRGAALSIVQHPDGMPKKLAARENVLTSVDDRFVWYQTDTMPGSSGAPVFNDRWELVAIHHAGAPAEGGLVRRDGASPSDGDDPFHLRWTSNEGVRASAVVAWLRARADARAHPLLAGLLAAAPEVPADAAPAPLPPAASGVRLEVARPDARRGEVVVTIPIQVRVSVGGAVDVKVGAAKEDP